MINYASFNETIALIVTNQSAITAINESPLDDPCKNFHVSTLN